jgi:hypothetical protein
MPDRLETWDEPPETEREARQRAEDLRRQITEEARVFFDAGTPELHRQLARLYVEWALEHVQDLQEFDSDTSPSHPYAGTAETDLKNIVLRLD